MNSDKDWEQEPNDRSLENVERLLRQMSLKRPNQNIATPIASGKRPKQARRILREFAIAIACLLMGILMGRISNDPNVNDTGNTNVPVAAVTSHNKSQTTPIQNKQLSGQRTEDKQTLDSKSDVQLVDEGLFLVNGKYPVRKFTSISEETVSILDPETGEPVSVTIPVKKTVVTSSQGI